MAGTRSKHGSLIQGSPSERIPHRMTDNAITDIAGRTVLVGAHKLYLADENPSAGIGIYDDDDDSLPTPILELNPEIAARLARDLMTVVCGPDCVNYVAGFAALSGDPT